VSAESMNPRSHLSGRGFAVDEAAANRGGIFGDGAGSFDSCRCSRGSLAKMQLSWKISDHHPPWVEFSV
jgi:hypothetical protein